jgi:proteic killer suppression protein
LDFSFENRDLRKECEDEQVAIEKYGTEISMKLQGRIADIIAATTVSDLLAGNPSMLNKGSNNYKVDLSSNCLLVFCSANTKVPQDSNGSVDWERVTRIKILEIQHING